MTSKSKTSQQGRLKELQDEISALTLQMQEKDSIINGLKKSKRSDGSLCELESEILDEARKIATNQVSSCFTLVEKTRQLINLQKA